MKRKILLSEKELVSLIKETIMENKKTDSLDSWGCDSLKMGSEDIEWCKCNAQKIKEKKWFLIQEIDRLKELIQNEEFSDLGENLKLFKKEDPFFEWRISQFLEVQNELLKNSKQNEQKIKDFKYDIAKKALFVQKKEDKDEYSLLNKLNTNYSALSYLLTLHRKKNNLVGVPFKDVFESYFDRDNKQREQGRESVFFNFLLDYLGKKEDAVAIMSEVFRTIEKTTGIGTRTENEALQFLVNKFGKENVKNYSGDYSFVDLFGIDFMVSGIVPELGFVPVQIKTNVKDMKGNPRVAENIAIGKAENGVWKIELFDGSKFIRNINL